MKPDIKYVIGLCRDAAQGLYSSRGPSKAYATRVEKLLVGTAAVESGFSARRQYGFRWDTNAGAWGLWQTELPAVKDSLRHMKVRPMLLARAGRWLHGEFGGDMEWIYTLDDSQLLRAIASHDRLAVLFARIHYMRFSPPVPAGLAEQAMYWKVYYNTTAGAGTPGGYIDAFERLVTRYYQ